MIIKGKSLFAVLLIMVMTTLMTGCSSNFTAQSKAQVSGSSDDWTDFKRKEISLDAGESIEFEYESHIDGGTLKMKLYTEADDVVLELGVDTKDHHKLEVTESGDYYLMIVGDEFDGQFEVAWTIKS